MDSPSLKFDVLTAGGNIAFASITYVWFSPLGEKKYASSEAITTKTRPMIRLAL